MGHLLDGSGCHRVDCWLAGSLGEHLGDSVVPGVDGRWDQTFSPTLKPRFIHPLATHLAGTVSCVSLSLCVPPFTMTSLFFITEQTLLVFVSGMGDSRVKVIGLYVSNWGSPFQCLKLAFVSCEPAWATPCPHPSTGHH